MSSERLINELIVYYRFYLDNEKFLTAMLFMAVINILKEIDFGKERTETGEQRSILEYTE